MRALLFVVIALVTPQHPAYSIERMKVWWDGAVLGCAALRQAGDLWLIWRAQNDLHRANL